MRQLPLCGRMRRGPVLRLHTDRGALPTLRPGRWVRGLEAEGKTPEQLEWASDDCDNGEFRQPGRFICRGAGTPAGKMEGRSEPGTVYGDGAAALRQQVPEGNERQAMRCEKCEHLVYEPGTKGRGFLRCMAPGPWRGRTMAWVREDYLDVEKYALRPPAWCFKRKENT